MNIHSHLPFDRKKYLVQAARLRLSSLTEVMLKKKKKKKKTINMDEIAQKLGYGSNDEDNHVGISRRGSFGGVDRKF